MKELRLPDKTRRFRQASKSKPVETRRDPSKPAIETHRNPSKPVKIERFRLLPKWD